MKFFYDSVKKPCNVYTDGLPEDFETPALYFPTPSLLPDNHSNTEYKIGTAIQVKVFGDSDKDANDMTNAIIKRVFDNRNLIPIVLEDGFVVKDKFVRLSKCESRAIEDCVVLLSVEWDMNYSYSRDNDGVIIGFTEIGTTLK